MACHGWTRGRRGGAWIPRRDIGRPLTVCGIRSSRPPIGRPERVAGDGLLHRDGATSPKAAVRLANPMISSCPPLFYIPSTTRARRPSRLWDSYAPPLLSHGTSSQNTTGGTTATYRCIRPRSTAVVGRVQHSEGLSHVDGDAREPRRGRQRRRYQQFLAVGHCRGQNAGRHAHADTTTRRWPGFQ